MHFKTHLIAEIEVSQCVSAMNFKLEPFKLSPLL